MIDVDFVTRLTGLPVYLVELGPGRRALLVMPSDARLTAEEGERLMSFVLRLYPREHRMPPP